MSSTVIKVENLSKRYSLGVISSGTLYRDMQSWWAKLRGKEDPNRKICIDLDGQIDSKEKFWALQNVSFEIKKGDVVGIIGRNGAGKSTLLKILSRVTGPTSGSIKIKGRVASLLEVGTGFHPELTGRENIYLNGTILGMRKQEIDKKFDEIVNFAEIEKFVDTPVKRYSSGMYVRLAFAVAAHLEPEILIVDEVLAVGDAAFQKKCLGKMQEVGKQGRTVLFVSHNMNAIEQMCRSVILLEKGKLIAHKENKRELILKYFERNKNLEMKWINTDNNFNNMYFQPNKMYFVDKYDKDINTEIRNDEDTWICIEGIVKQRDEALTIGYAVYDDNGHALYWSYQTDIEEEKWVELDSGMWKLKSKIPKRLFNEGTYRFELIGGLHYREWLFQPNVNAPYVFLTISGGLSDSPYWHSRREGIIAPVIPWKIEKQNL